MYFLVWDLQPLSIVKKLIYQQDYEDFDMANEVDELEKFLHIATNSKILDNGTKVSVTFFMYYYYGPFFCETRYSRLLANYLAKFSNNSSFSKVKTYFSRNKQNNIVIKYTFFNFLILDCHNFFCRKMEHGNYSEIENILKELLENPSIVGLLKSKCFI